MSTAKKLKASQKARDKQVIALRAALFAEGGGDKDVTAGITSAFMKVLTVFPDPSVHRSIHSVFNHHHHTDSCF